MTTAEELRIGRGSTVTETPIAVAVVDGPFLGANVNRIAIIIWNNSTATITLSSKGTAIAGQGVVIPPSTGPHRLSEADFGNLLIGAWRSIGSGVATIGVFEESSTAG